MFEAICNHIKYGTNKGNIRYKILPAVIDKYDLSYQNNLMHSTKFQDLLWIFDFGSFVTFLSIKIVCV